MLLVSLIIEHQGGNIGDMPLCVTGQSVLEVEYGADVKVNL